MLQYEIAPIENIGKNKKNRTTLELCRDHSSYVHHTNHLECRSNCPFDCMKILKKMHSFILYYTHVLHHVERTLQINPEMCVGVVSCVAGVVLLHRRKSSITLFYTTRNAHLACNTNSIE